MQQEPDMFFWGGGGQTSSYDTETDEDSPGAQDKDEASCPVPCNYHLN